MTTAQAIRDIVRPHETPDRLVRLGRDRDGGYVLPLGAMESAEVLYSYGVGDDTSFEFDWWARSGKPAHLHDHTVAAPPPLPNQVFHAEPLEGDNFFRHLVENGDWGSGHVLLKIDVEGDEYGFIEAVAADGAEDHVQDHVHCLIIEFHEILDRPFISCMNKLLRDYAVVHFHFNNCGPFTGGIGHTVEVTLLRRDHETLGPTTRTYPIPGLDFPNNGGEEGWRLSYAGG